MASSSVTWMSVLLTANGATAAACSASGAGPSPTSTTCVYGTRQPDRGKAVSAGIDAELLGHAGEYLQRFSREFAVTVFVGQSVKPEHHNRGDGIAGRSWRILEWLAPGGECADSGRAVIAGHIEEAAVLLVVEMGNHEVGDRFAEAKIAEVGGAFIRLEAGECGEGVVVEQARNLALPAGESCSE